MTKSILTLQDLSNDELVHIVENSKKLKGEIKKGKVIDKFKGKVVGTLFEKPSTRTRAGFESAALRLGAGTVYLPSNELQLKRGEPVKDVARILGSYLNTIVARVFSQDTAVELAKYSGVPVINGLSDFAHPTQAICDLLTILEVKGYLKGLTLAYIGDGNNVAHSLFEACAMVGMNMKAACPKGFLPDATVMKFANDVAKKTSAKLAVVEDPKDAAEGADILYTDVWVSMGEEGKEEEKKRIFKNYQINAELLKAANKDAHVMHCLPAHRGWEITDDVLEGPQSIAWQQGENKMYGAIGVLDFVMS